jgi:hypothetical protein
MRFGAKEWPTLDGAPLANESIDYLGFRLAAKD